MVLHQKIRQLENDALDRMQKEAVMVKAIPQCLEEVRTLRRNLIQDSQCSSQYPNQTTLAYKAELLWLEPTC